MPVEYIITKKGTYTYWSLSPSELQEWEGEHMKNPSQAKAEELVTEFVDKPKSYEDLRVIVVGRHNEVSLSDTDLRSALRRLFEHGLIERYEELFCITDKGQKLK